MYENDNPKKFLLCLKGSCGNICMVNGVWRCFQNSPSTFLSMQEAADALAEFKKQLPWLTEVKIAAYFQK